MKAVRVHYDRRVLSDGSVQEIVIWRLPEITIDHPYGVKYRLYFGLADRSFVRYDNERGKGDHKHLNGIEEPYVFTSITQLMNDFFADVHKVQEGSL
jgi:hypothetical protein